VSSSAAFAAALRNPTVAAIVIDANFTLLAEPDFSQASRIIIARPVSITPACSSGSPRSTEISLGDNVVSRVLVASGGRLEISGLRLASAALMMRHPVWPDYNPLLLSLIDINGTGAVKLSDVVISTRSPVNVTLMLQRYPIVMRPLYSVGQSGASLRVRSWKLTQAQYRQGRQQRGSALMVGVATGESSNPGRRLLDASSSSSSRSSMAAAAAAADASSTLSKRQRRLLERAARGTSSSRRLLQQQPDPGWPGPFANSRPFQPDPSASWQFENVELEMPNTRNCFVDTGLGPGTPCESGQTLKALLRDPTVTQISLIGDSIVHEEGRTNYDLNTGWAGINITHKVRGLGVCRLGVRGPPAEGRARA